MAYHGIFYESLIFSRYTHQPIQVGECVCLENRSDKSDIPQYTTRECLITILYHAMENAVTNTINATYVRRTMGWLGVISSNIEWPFCILIGYSF